MENRNLAPKSAIFELRPFDIPHYSQFCQFSNLFALWHKSIFQFLFPISVTRKWHLSIISFRDRLNIKETWKISFRPISFCSVSGCYFRNVKNCYVVKISSRHMKHFFVEEKRIIVIWIISYFKKFRYASKSLQVGIFKFDSGNYVLNKQIKTI